MLLPRSLPSLGAAPLAAPPPLGPRGGAPGPSRRAQSKAPRAPAKPVPLVPSPHGTSSLPDRPRNEKGSRHLSGIDTLSTLFFVPSGCAARNPRATLQSSTVARRRAVTPSVVTRPDGSTIRLADIGAGGASNSA